MIARILCALGLHDPCEGVLWDGYGHPWWVAGCRRKGCPRIEMDPLIKWEGKQGRPN